MGFTRPGGGGDAVLRKMEAILTEQGGSKLKMV
jgi:hypothetical protein